MCERTGVDRATFYRHFDGMDDLVADALGDLANRSVDQWEAVSTGSGTQVAESTEIFADYLKYVEDNWRLYRWVLGPNGSPKIVHALLERSALSVAHELHRLYPSLSQEKIDFRAAFAAGGIVGLCIHWPSTETPSCSAQELSARILEISDQCLEHLFSAGEPSARQPG